MIAVLALMFALASGPAGAAAPEAPAAPPPAVAAPAATCRLPAGFAEAPVALPHARAAVAARKRLVVMALGGTPMANGVAGDAAMGYPARMGAHLARLLPGVEVVIDNRAIPNRSARSMGQRLPEEIAQVRPDLVIWASGSRDALRKTDLAVYARTLQGGIAAIRAGGADAMLIDTQYAPGWAAIPMLDDYREVIETVAEMAEAPLFPRHLLMQDWHDHGVINLAETDQGQQVALARLLFDCLGDALARMVARGLAP